jgi:hypothetical protein
MPAQNNLSRVVMRVICYGEKYNWEVMWTNDSGLVKTFLFLEYVDLDQKRGKDMDRCIYCNIYSIIEEEKRAIITDCL